MSEEIKKENPLGEEAAEEKIVYPRDPCPCGSGRTYADCCGWKQARPDYKEA